MTEAEGHEREYQIFQVAKDLPPAEQSAALDYECAGNPSLRQRVEKLLRHHDPIASFLHSSTLPIGGGGKADGFPHFSIDGYEIRKLLGQGAQGKVYAAIQKSTKSEVAVKVLNERYTDERGRKRFEREYELIAQLRHPNIVTIHDAAETSDGRPCYFMEYVDGLSLDRYVHTNQLTIDHTLELFITVCATVQHAHHNRVIHRDLKPGNILVDAFGRPKLLDFGLAKWLIGPVDASAISLAGEGTAEYMSPEQASGNTTDTRTDVYALGVILYELLTGEYPYPVRGKGYAEQLKHVMETPPTPPSKMWAASTRSVDTQTSRLPIRFGRCPIDKQLEQIVLRSLEKERERRYQTAGDLAGDLTRRLAGEPIGPGPFSIWHLLTSAVRRYKKIAIAAALVGGVALFFGGVEIRVQLALADMRNQAAYSHEEISRSRQEFREGKLEDAGESYREAQRRFKKLSDATIPDPVIDLARQLEADLLRLQDSMRLVWTGIRENEAGNHRKSYETQIGAAQKDPTNYRAYGNAAIARKDEFKVLPPDKRDPAILEEALQLCDYALRLNEDSKATWNVKSVVLYLLDRLTEAEVACRQALNIDSGYFYASSNLAKVLALQRRIEDAITVAEEGARACRAKKEKTPYDDGILRTLGTLQLHLGEPEALESLNEAVQIEKNSDNFLMLSRLYLTLAELRNEEAALENAKNAIALARDPTTALSPKYSRTLAQAHLRMGDYVNAARNARYALEDGDQPAYAHLIAAIAEARLGNMEAATSELSAADENWPVQFIAGKEVIVTAENELLWFDTVAELNELRDEAESLLVPEPTAP